MPAAISSSFLGLHYSDRAGVVSTNIPYWQRLEDDAADRVAKDRIDSWARRVDDRLLGGIPLTEFGADPTGRTDSSDAIQAAIDYSYNNHSGSHPPIVAGTGRFVISRSIRMRPHVRLIGTGEGSSHSAVATQLGWGTEFLAAPGFDGWAFIYDSSSFDGGVGGTDSYNIMDSEISRIAYRGTWSGPGAPTALSGGMIFFDGVLPIQGCRFENLICANVAGHVVHCNVLPLPGLFNNIWGRKVGGDVLNVYCGIRHGEVSARTGHYFRASNIQGDFIVGSIISIDATPLVEEGRSLASTVFYFDGIKHEVNSGVSGSVDPTNTYGKHTIRLTNMDRATVRVVGVNVLPSNTHGGGTPNTVDGAVLFITGSSGLGPYWDIRGSRYGSGNDVADFLVWDTQHGTAGPFKVSKKYRAASWMPSLDVRVGRAGSEVVGEVRVSSDSVGTFDDHPRRQTLADGTEKWGSGATAPDISLYRQAENRLTVDDVFQARKILARGQTVLTSSSFALSPGWGSTATLAVDASTTSCDQAGMVTVTADGSGISENPTVTLTFADTTVVNTAGSSAVGWARRPIPMASLGRLSTGNRSLRVSADTNFTTLTMQLEGTPVSGSTYVIYYSLMG